MMKALASTLLAMTTAACATADPRDNVSTDLETPAYTTAVRDGIFEVRRYAPFVVARTMVEASDLSDASSAGFRRLAGYIFGKNTRNAEVAMTAPVSAQPVGGSEKIAMTAPVAATQEGAQWEITFSMPSKYRLDELPTPKDRRVELLERPASCQAAVVFAGLTTEDNLATHRAMLRDWMKDQNLTPAGAMTVARYNDPLTLPWNRRNELLVTLDEESCARLP